MVVVCVRAPDLPVTVTMKVPRLARLPAVKVKVLVEVVGFALKDADTRLGRPEADKLTLPLKPFDGVMVMAAVPWVPRPILKLLGDADREKFGAAFTVREMVVELVKLPDAPVMVTVNVPVAAVILAVSVNVLVPVVLLGLKEAVTPPGRPEADKLTLALKPLSGLTVMVLALLAPCVMLNEPGDAVRV